MREGLVIKGQNAARHVGLVVEVLHVKQPSAADEALPAACALVCHQMSKGACDALDVAREIVDGIGAAGAYPVDVVKEHLVFDQAAVGTGRIRAAHAAALKKQRRFEDIALHGHG